MSKVDKVLFSLLKAYSPTGHEENAQGILVDIAEELGLKVKVDDAGNVLASKGDESNIWLVGHYDTVPGELPVKRSGGMITGRGAVDAKGPLSAMLVAASLSKDPVTVAALVGEEGDSRGARHLLKGKLPPYIIIGEPSNTIGVIIAYRGGAHLEIRCQAGGGHSSSPGVSAVDKLIDSILKVKEIAPGTKYEEPSAAVTIIKGGEAFNVLPRHASATIDLRVSPSIDPADVVEEIRSRLLDRCLVEVKWMIPPTTVRPSDPVPRSLIRSILKLERRPKLLKKYGSSDMNRLYKAVRSIAAYGPGDSRLAHTNEEIISINELELAVKVYKGAIEQLSQLGRCRAIQ